MYSRFVFVGVRGNFAIEPKKKNLAIDRNENPIGRGHLHKQRKAKAGNRKEEFLQLFSI
jgi:hypothetical protein